MSEDVMEEEEFVGEKRLGENSYQTPTSSSSDSKSSVPIRCESEPCSILFGDFQLSSFLKCCPDLTLAIIKPDAMKYAEVIERLMRDKGFAVVQKRFLHISPEQASNFYYEHYGRPHFPALVSAVSEAPIKVFVLRRKDAVETWKQICGPTSVNEARRKWPDSLRARFGTPGEDHKNACHASATEEKALEEIRFFFPHVILDHNIRNEIRVEDFLRDNVNPTLLKGLAQVCKNKPIDPILWLAEWLLTNNPNKPKMSKIIALTST